MPSVGSSQRCASALLLLLLFSCWSPSHALTYRVRNLTTPSQAPYQASPASPEPLPILSNALALSSSSQLASPVITSVSGCTSSANGVTRGCNMSSYITITGSDFVFAGSDNSFLLIAGRVRCSLFSVNFVSNATVVVLPCLYYYPIDTALSLALILDGTTTAPLSAALTFTNVAPVLTGITGCSIPPYGSCNNLQVNRLTVYGKNFLSSPFPRFDVMIGSDSLQCATILSTIRYTQFECLIREFGWIPQPPHPSQRWPGIVRVINPNWLEQMIESNVLQGAISFIEINSTAPLASSTGGGGGSGNGPLLWQVSGCVDADFLTVECPHDTPVVLTLFGLTFSRALPNVIIGDATISTACSPVIVSSDQVLRCTFDTSRIVPLRTTPLDVTVNSSLGSITLQQAISITDVAVMPAITTVTGCGVDSDRQTEQCTRQSEVRLAGSHFPRWLSPVLRIADQLDLPCQWRGSEVWVYCPLDSVSVDELPKGQLLPIRVRFGSDRVSDGNSAYISIRTTVPPPPPVSGSSSGGSGSGSGDGLDDASDELRGVKVGLFVLCVLALVAIVVGAGVWLVGLWTAHRRAFVSANGQAAVDMRQVLLH